MRFVFHYPSTDSTSDDVDRLRPKSEPEPVDATVRCSAPR